MDESLQPLQPVPEKDLTLLRPGEKLVFGSDPWKREFKKACLTLACFEHNGVALEMYVERRPGKPPRFAWLTVAGMKEIPEGHDEAAHDYLVNVLKFSHQHAEYTVRSAYEGIAVKKVGA